MSSESDSDSPVDDIGKDPNVRYYLNIEPQCSRTTSSSEISSRVNKSSSTAVGPAKSKKSPSVIF